MFRVFDDGQPADCFHCKVDASWKKSSFETFKEAEAYALNWLGVYGPGPGVLKPNVPYDYSCCELPCMIEIREEK